MAPNELPELRVPDVSAWRQWLEDHHDTAPGVHLVLHKKGGEVTALSYEAAVEEALCYGWIDGLASSRDEGSWRVRMTPRGPRSHWSDRNVGRVERLENEGRMRPSGAAAVKAAKENGRWPA